MVATGTIRAAMSRDYTTRDGQEEPAWGINNKKKKPTVSLLVNV